MKCKILTLGRNAREVDVPEGSTVLDAITAAEAPKDGAYTRHMNGAPCFDTDTVVEGCVISLVPQVKGGC